MCGMMPNQGEGTTGGSSRSQHQYGSTVWTRLEPRPRSDTLDRSLRAEVRDPLWLLSRQWQVNEFRGEDGGSAVQADLTIEEDDLSRVELRGGDREHTEPFDYDGHPLESTVERETVTDDPPMRLRAEAGQQFLRLLRSNGVGEFTVEDFSSGLVLDAPEQALEKPDRRYVDLMEGRTLDGTAVARDIRKSVGNIDDVVDSGTDTTAWTGIDSGTLPLPDGEGRTDSFDRSVESFYGWYVDLYDEPTVESGSAWDPQRLEYRFAVATGESGTESVLEAPAFTGRALDWYAFSTRGGESLEPPDEGCTASRTETRMPTAMSAPGMPAPQWWEFEDADIDLTEITDDGASLSNLLFVEFAQQFGNDWFKLSLDTAVGTMSRITDLTITDAFGVEETAEPIMESDWQLFMHDLPGHDEPGLFLPPTLGESKQSDPVEKVVFARDDIANMAFAIERRVESPTGRSVDRTEFNEPELVIDAVQADEDPDNEYIRLSNPGEDRLILDGHTVAVQYPEEIGESARTIYTFADRTLGPGETVEVYTGEPPEPADVGGGEQESRLTTAEALTVRNADGRLVRRHLLARPSKARADYRLSTSVPRYWFPFVATREDVPVGEAFTAETDEFKLERALLLDAETLDLPIEQIPHPLGRILTPDPDLLPEDADSYEVFDEEVTRSGVEVTRRYRFARWTDGSGYLWSSRKRTVGDTLLHSGLQFDVLEDRNE